MKSLFHSVLLLLSIAATTGTASASAAATTASSKLWATDFAAYVNANPKGRWIVAESTMPCISAEEAEASARACAVEALMPQVRSRVKGRIDMKHLRGIVDSSLREGGWVVDRHLQANERPYGTIWRESILIDASNRKLDELARRAGSIARRDFERRAIVIGSGTILSVIGVVVFFILNWLTRGYLRFRLAMISLGVVALSTAVIGMLAHL